MRAFVIPVATVLTLVGGLGSAWAQDAEPAAEQPKAVQRVPSGTQSVAMPTSRSAPTREHRVVPRAPERMSAEPVDAVVAHPTSTADEAGAVREQRRGGGGGRGSGPGGAVSRPREGRPATGTARPRTGSDGYWGPSRGGSNVYVVRPNRWYGAYGYYPFGLGLSSFYYDPFWGSPYAYGAWGYGPWGPAYGPAYGGWGGGGGVGWDTGSLRLKVKPRHAEVYVDGYLVGSVDEFDGAFQSLPLEAGTHSLEIRADGYEPLTFDIRLLPQRKITYEGELQKR